MYPLKRVKLRRNEVNSQLMVSQQRLSYKTVETTLNVGKVRGITKVAISILFSFSLSTLDLIFFTLSIRKLLLTIFKLNLKNQFFFSFLKFIYVCLKGKFDTKLTEPLQNGHGFYYYPSLSQIMIYVNIL